MPQSDFVPEHPGYYWIGPSSHLRTGFQSVLKVERTRRGDLEASPPPGFYRDITRYQWMCGAITPSDVGILKGMCRVAKQGIYDLQNQLESGNTTIDAEFLQKLNQASLALYAVEDCCESSMLALSNQTPTG